MVTVPDTRVPCVVRALEALEMQRKVEEAIEREDADDSPTREQLGVLQKVHEAAPLSYIARKADGGGKRGRDQRVAGRRIDEADDGVVIRVVVGSP